MFALQSVGNWLLRAGILAVVTFEVSAAPAVEELPLIARENIAALQAEKESRTPIERKLDSQIVYAIREQNSGQVAPGLTRFQSSLRRRAGNRILVDLNAEVSAALLKKITAAGGTVLFSSKEYHTVRAELPLSSVLALSAAEEITNVRPADEAAFNAAPPIEGDIAHGADLTRAQLGVDGAGIKVGVLSDSVDYLSSLQNGGLLPNVTVLPGQAGTGTGEGTAMLQIVHQLAPGASLYFATAFGGIPSFAQNIRALRDAGCTVIVDDVIYFRESPFQEGPIAQAVLDVCSSGVMFFSSAGNGGNQNDGTSTTWRGDFVDGGPATIGRGGRLHSFGAATFNTVLTNPISSILRADLFWTDPLGASTNDYDLYVLNASGAVVRSSSNIQDGNDDPYEMVPLVQVGERLVIVKASGEDRYLHLTTYGGRLTFSTPGSTRGHNAAVAENAFSVAAARVPSPAALFTGGASNPVEYFSSDGPRRVFFQPDGTPITPDNFSSSGGMEVAKPDIAAADGVSTSVPGFSPFYGTSAAAPHAAGITALLWSHEPSLTPAQLHEALVTSALDIESPGPDRDSGTGLAMATEAMNGLPQAAPNLALQGINLIDGNGDGSLQVNECGEVEIVLRNLVGLSGQTATGVVAVLTTSDPAVRVDPLPRLYPDIAGQQSATNATTFLISTTPDFVCGRGVACELLVSTANGKAYSLPFTLTSQMGSVGSPVVFGSTNVPMDIPDLDFVESTVNVEGVSQQVADVVVSVHVTHPYDSDLTLSLIGPDGTTVLLSANNGGSGQNYGFDCSNPTVFTDAATDSITAGTAPFAGLFRPQQSLIAFRGKAGADVNGVWKLRAADRASMDSGTIQCWSLQLTSYTCSDGGGACLLPPSIVQQPTAVTVTNGNPAALQATVEGTAPLNFQWFKDETNVVEGATGPELQIGSVLALDAGIYTLVATNFYGAVTSAPAQLEVILPAAILTGPVDTRAVAGETNTLSVLAEGTEPLDYQWLFWSGESSSATFPLPGWWLDPAYQIEGATNAQLALSNISPAMAGLYVVRVSNPFATVFSDPATFDVLLPPSITEEPIDLVVTNGDFASFTVAAAGTEPLSYQWFFNTTNEIAEATGTNLDLTAATLAQAGTYSVMVSNEVGTIRSREALLTVLSAPVIVENPISQTATNGDTVTLSVLATGSAPLEYQWFFNETNLLAEATTSDLVLSNVTAAAAGSYTVAISNLLGIALSEPATLTVVEPPSITEEPIDLVVTNGDFASFTVAAAGTEPLSYQWFFNTTNEIAEATGTNLDLAGVTLAQAGTYSVVVSNEVGMIRSREALLTVLSAPVIVENPISQTATNGDTVTLSVLATGSAPLEYQWFFNETNLLAEATTSDLVLSNVTAAAAGSYTVAISNLLGIALSEPAMLTVVEPPSITEEPIDLVVTNGDFASFTVAAAGTEPLSYQWFFNTTNEIAEATGTNLDLTAVTLAQAGTYSVMVSNEVGTIRSREALLTVLSAPVIVENPISQTATNGDTVTLSVLATGSAPLEYQWFFNETNLLAEATTSGLVLSNVTAAAAGSYTVAISNLLGVALSEPAMLTVVEPPSITEEPIDLVVTNGDFASFTVAAAGTEPLNYQWFFNTTNEIAEATGTNLDLTAVTLAQAGTYSVMVSNEVGTIRSREALLTVLSAPVIVENPISQTATNGDTVTLSVLATGSAPLEYQWFFNETNLLAEATTSDLVLSNVTTAAAGSYTVTISNLLGVALSEPATLTVVEPPSITEEPIDLVVTNGDFASFTVAAAGTEPLSYQWFFNTTNEIAEATGTNLDLTAVTLAQAGTYSVVVSNEVGTIRSREALLTVLSAPVIVENPISQTATNGDTVTLSVLATGSAPLEYQWFFNETNLLAEATTSDLVLSNVTTAAAGSYTVAISNLLGIALSEPAMLTVVEPPSITEEPIDLVVTSGDFASFTVAAAGTEPLSYQWFFNTTNEIAEATGTNLDLTAVTLAQAGTYSVIVSNEVGMIRSREALLTVLSAPVIVENPISQTATNGDTVTLSVLATGSAPLEYQWFFNETNLLAEATTSGLVLSNVTAAAAGSYTVAISNLLGIALSEPAMLTVVEPPSITEEPIDLVVTNGDFASFTVAAAGTEPLSYQWFFNTTNEIAEATGTNLDLTAVTLAQAGIYSVIVSNEVGMIRSREALLTVLSAPVIVENPISQTATNGDTVTLSVLATGSAPLEYQWFFNETNLLAEATTSDLVLSNVTTAAAGSYTVAISNLLGVALSEPATLTVVEPPSITEEPIDLVVTNGDFASFTVAAAGTEPLSYQWFFNTTNEIAEATGTNLDLTAATLAQAGTYSVVVSNEVGTIRSREALLTVLSAPMIVENPISQIATNGDTVTLSVLATGSVPLEYQWFFVGTNDITIASVPDPDWWMDTTNRITEATNSDLVLNNVSLEAAGNYVVLVTNSLGAAVSAPGKLTVVDPIRILVEPQPVAVLLGGTAQFTVTATGAPKPVIQWMFNATNVVEGATSNVLTIINVQPVNEGGYSAVLSNSIGVVTSSAASLIIADPPSVLQQPVNVTIAEGGTALFNVTAAGTAPLTFTWFLNETNLVSASEQSQLAITNAAFSQSGSYRVTVSNAVGSASSQAAALRVLVPSPMTSSELVEGTMTFTFDTMIGLRYTVEFTGDIRSNLWTRLPSAEKLLGTGIPISVQDTNTSDSKRFYRVRVE